ncbi:recombinase family protein, partial [Lachnotalea glycerini]
MHIGAVYIRVSTDKQEELSPDAQRRLLLDYAKKNSIIIPAEHIYIENGISGRKADKRPQFQKMISIAKSKEHPFDIILVWKYSRFARNQEESIVYKSLLKKNNIDVISISEPLIDGPFGSLIERIIEWMDEYYSIRLSGEVMRGMTEKALRGGYQAIAPLGYDTIKGDIPVVNKEQAKIIQYIFEQYVNYGLDKTTIARNLNEQGYKTLRGNNFEKRTIDYILENPFYIGKIRWNKSVHGSRSLKDENDIITAEGQHEPIIRIETFNKAVERSKAEYAPKLRKGIGYSKHWLCGLIKCNICGSNLVYYKDSRNKSGAG